MPVNINDIFSAVGAGLSEYGEQADSVLVEDLDSGEILTVPQQNISPSTNAGNIVTTQDNTMMYLLIGAAVLIIGIFIYMKFK